MLALQLTVTLASAALLAAKDHPPALGRDCLSCHPAIRNRKVLHAPVQEKECASCHDVPAAGGPSKLADTPEKLCLLCHDEKKFQAPYVHGPVAVGACVACHDPHGADAKGLARASGAPLCFSCHAEMQARLAAARFQHKPVTAGCTACHDPHAAAQKFQLKADTAGLCGGCHQPVVRQAGTSAVKHAPVTDRRSCLNCHDPHAADQRPQLRADGLGTCLACHDRKVAVTGGELPDMRKLLLENSDHHGPIRERDCSGCHQPHGAGHFRLLKENYPKEFYAPFQAENFALCFGCHDAALPRDERTTTLTDFRNGDRNLHFVHVNKTPKGRTCRSCHEVHASNLPNHLRKSVPFGNWELPINFTKTARGGSCAPGCHASQSYDRGEKKSTSSQ